MDSKVILSQINLEELIELIGSKVGDKIKHLFQPQQVPALQTELPIGFKTAMVVLDMKERTLRAKCASKEIPHYQRARQLYFFESELIEYIKTGKKKTNSEIQEEADEYISKRRTK